MPMTVGLVIVSHSARLAAGVAELAGQMSQGKTPIAAAGGTVDDVLGTSVDKILAAIQSVDNPDGVLVLVDLGSALLSTEMALEMLSDEQRKRIRLTYAPLVEGALSAALEASLGHPLPQVQQAAEKTAQVEQLHLLKPLSQEEQPPQEHQDSAGTLSPEETAPLEAQVRLTDPAGLHARPATLFVQTAERFQAHIRVSGHGKEADATSIFELLSLSLRQGETVTIRASGVDAQAALAALSELVRANFYETESEGAPPAPASTGEVPPPASLPRRAGEPWRGRTTSAGVAVGPALLATTGAINLGAVARHPIAADQVGVEQQRLREALHSAAQELRSLATTLQSSVGQANAAIFDAQALMLLDPALREDALHVIEAEHIDAAGALAKTGEHFAARLETLDEPLIAARAVDVRDAVSRVIERLGGSGQAVPKRVLSDLSQQVILLARDLTPSDTAQLRSGIVLGIGTVQGGPTAHAAILASALGIPAMAGLDETILQMIHSGDEVGLDADNGLLYQHPAPGVRAELMKRAAEREQQQAALKAESQKTQAPLIFNGRHILLMANIGSEAEAEAARQWGAEGVGLLRTEFLFAQAPTLPNEDEQRHLYMKAFRAFNGDSLQASKPVVVRTLDAGADKPMPALNAILGQAVEANPALGLRGIRIHLAHQTLLEQQLAALLLAAAETGTQLHIMFPMITTVEELQMARSIFDRVYAQLSSRQAALPAHVPIGIMVEVPSAVVMASELAELADFFSIGANDLLQYTLASDRTNASVANLYNPMQPAVLRLIHQVATAGRSAGKPVAVCGEMAGDVRLAPVLVGLGIEELSMTPTALPKVRAALAPWSSQELSDLAERILRLKTVAEVERVSTEFQH
jgi:multiphosphoryl transfer protein